MSFVTVDHVSHSYFSPKSSVEALKDIELEIHQGEFVSFLGPSGCGKSTLLSIIAGLLKPTFGEVRVNGKNPMKTKNTIGYMLQQDYLFPWKTIRENTSLGASLLQLPSQETDIMVLALLEEMGLSKFIDSYPHELSGGMRQRASLVRTLVTNPTLLLLDEPFSALDFQTKLKMEDLVLSTLKSYDKTAILVTHDISEAIAMSDRIILFSKHPGKIHRVFEVPKELVDISPFEARNHASYPAFFHLIWKELENLE